MKTRFYFFALLIFIIFGCDKKSVDPEPATNSLEHILSTSKNRYKLPSIAGGILTDNDIQIYATGIRRIGASDKVTENDKYFIGSNAKAMTATMIATLVEDGLLSWKSKISEILPEFQNEVPAEFGNVTLTQLLNHHGGIAPFEELEDILSIPQFSGTIKNQRYEFAKWVINYSDKANIGKYIYSNAGYVVAAAMAERVTNQIWEELMHDKLFTPLSIAAEFAWPAEHGADAPWGHTFENNKYVPFNPDSSLQFPEILNPAGNVSINVADYLKFAQLHADGLNGDSTFLADSTFQYLHTASDNYSLGWAEGMHPDTGVPVCFHDGSDGTFYAFVLIEPTLKKAVAVFTNCDSEAAEEAVINSVLEIIEKVN